MRRFFSGGRVSFIVGSALIVALLFTSIVYACAGLASLEMARHSLSTADKKVERGPCSGHKQDMCKSVRQRTLSLQAAQPLTDVSLDSLSVLLRETSSLSNLSGDDLLFTTAFHPLFKLPLTYSHLVLRI